MPAPSGYTQHVSGYWFNLSDQSGPYTFDGTTMALASPSVIASGATDSGGPVKIGGRFNTTQPTLTDGQRGDVQLDNRGNLIVSATGLGGTFWNYAPPTGGIVNTTTAVTIKTAAGAGIRNYLSTLHIAHDLLGGATEVAVRDGAAGTVIWRGRLQTTANDGFTISFNPPLRGTANTLMEVLTASAVTGGVYVNATGYTGA